MPRRRPAARSSPSSGHRRAVPDKPTSLIEVTVTSAESTRLAVGDQVRSSCTAPPAREHGMKVGRMTRVRRLPLLAERVLALLATALLACGLSGCGGSSAAPDLSEARERTVDGETARFTLTIGAAIAGRSVESAEAGTVSFADAPGASLQARPGPGRTAGADPHRPVHVHERERGRGSERPRGEALDEARHAAPSGKRGGQARRARARPRPRLPRRGRRERERRRPGDRRFRRR